MKLTIFVFWTLKRPNFLSCKEHRHVLSLNDAEHFREELRCLMNVKNT